MPDTPTPGQVARDAYWRVLGPQYAPCTPHDWTQLSPACQAAWEAAAQAVLDHAAFPPLALRLEEDSRGSQT